MYNIVFKAFASNGVSNIFQNFVTIQIFYCFVARTSKDIILLLRPVCKIRLIVCDCHVGALLVPRFSLYIYLLYSREDIDHVTFSNLLLSVKFHNFLLGL
jgi:hypothetical protein